MVFSSAVFLLLFLPAVLLVYYLVPDKIKNPVLLVSSLVFYAWGEPVYILIMLFSTVFDYCNGLMLERLDKKQNEKGRKLVLILSVAVNLGLLCFFKYTDFALESINTFTGAGLSLLNIALPIGISFYTFQTLSYTIDVYKREVKAQHRLLDFGMYICMFPQLIAGPIVRYKDIEGQLKARKISAAKACEGIFRFTIGLAKKVLLANSLGLLWDEISSFDGGTAALTAFIGAGAYMLQIYFDFSGYSDMAIGIGKMLGFDFLENFNFPYESKSITEFWRRWHISLGTWFREYLYIPLGGNRKGLARQLVNLFVVWFLTGLWHGAGWNFVIWGLYFFVLLVMEKFFLLKLLEKLPSVVSRLYTLFFVLISWVIFASENLKSALNYIVSLFGKNGFADGETLYYFKSNAVILVLGAVLSVSLVKRLFERIQNEKAKAVIKAVITFVLYSASLIMVINSSYNPFLYFRF